MLSARVTVVHLLSLILLAPATAVGAEPKKTIQVQETKEFIQIDSDALQARVRMKGYVSGVERASFLDKKTMQRYR